MIGSSAKAVKIQATGDTWDFIVVGAGSSGSVIAARLGESGARVLVLEAGPGKLNAISRVPGLHKAAWTYPRFNWSFVSEPEAQLGGRRIPIPRGRVVGGSSSINGLAYIRGCPADFDAWAASGAPGWGFRDVLPYFRKSETSWNGEAHWHGHDGPVQTAKPGGSHQFFDEISAAAQQAGFPVTDDPDGEHHEGVSRMPQNVGGGIRNSTATVYLEPALRAGKCELIANATVARVLFDGKRAVGVEFDVGGRRQSALVSREVILCGGAYNSPQLLMLSGIGDADGLKKQGIDPLLHAPGVGQGLQEHPMVYVTHAARESLLTTLRMDRLGRAMGRWMILRTGAMAMNGASGNIMLRTLPELKQPDIQIMLTSIRTDAQPWLVRRQPHQWAWAVCALHPHSRGTVTLASPDFRHAPAISFNMFDDRRDLETLVRGVQTAQSIAKQPALSSLITGPVWPTSLTASAPELEDFVRENAGITHHPVGTCRMGTDNLAVVDPALKVRGIEALRVADASIIPLIPGANTNPAAVMIGERASDLILDRST